jgi:hypothetical protein
MLAKGLAEAYVAYLPWLGFAIGLVFLIISTSPGLRSRRLRLMGLGVTAVSLVVLLGQQFL